MTYKCGIPEPEKKCKVNDIESTEAIYGQEMNERRKEEEDDKLFKRQKS